MDHRLSYQSLFSLFRLSNHARPASIVANGESNDEAFQPAEYRPAESRLIAIEVVEFGSGCEIQVGMDR